MEEWSIREVAHATGLTSRALRHYEQVGLLYPSRTADNGYRFYGEQEITRLYRILTLRSLDLPLAIIERILSDQQPLAEAVRAHVELLCQRRDHTNRQIARAERTLQTLQKGEEMSIDEIFDGVDNARYEAEVREKWGDVAWEQSAKRRADMDAPQRLADDQRSGDITARLTEAAASGMPAEASQFQSLIGLHYRWITDHWGGRTPTKQEYEGLAEMYVSDERFAAAYGGRDNAQAIRTAIAVWSEAHFADGE